MQVTQMSALEHRWVDIEPLGSKLRGGLFRSLMANIRAQSTGAGAVGYRGSGQESSGCSSCWVMRPTSDGCFAHPSRHSALETAAGREWSEEASSPPKS